MEKRVNSGELACVIQLGDRLKQLWLVQDDLAFEFVALLWRWFAPDMVIEALQLSVASPIEVGRSGLHDPLCPFSAAVNEVGQLEPRSEHWLGGPGGRKRHRGAKRIAFQTAPPRRRAWQEPCSSN